MADVLKGLLSNYRRNWKNPLSGPSPFSDEDVVANSRKSFTKSMNENNPLDGMAERLGLDRESQPLLSSIEDAGKSGIKLISNLGDSPEQYGRDTVAPFLSSLGGLGKQAVKSVLPDFSDVPYIVNYLSPKASSFKPAIDIAKGVYKGFTEGPTPEPEPFKVPSVDANNPKEYINRLAELTGPDSSGGIGDAFDELDSKAMDSISGLGKDAPGVKTQSNIPTIQKIKTKTKTITTPQQEVDPVINKATQSSNTVPLEIMSKDDPRVAKRDAAQVEKGDMGNDIGGLLYAFDKSREGKGITNNPYFDQMDKMELDQLGKLNAATDDRLQFEDQLKYLYQNMDADALAKQEATKAALAKQLQDYMMKQEEMAWEREKQNKDLAQKDRALAYDKDKDKLLSSKPIVDYAIKKGTKKSSWWNPFTRDETPDVDTLGKNIGDISASALNQLELQRELARIERLLGNK